MEVEEPRVKADVPDSAAEVERRGLVRRDNGCTSRHKGVGWHTTNRKWKGRIEHGGKQEHLGLFATEQETKACYDARRLELGLGQVPSHVDSPDQRRRQDHGPRHL
jgi:hypothetical protein